MLYQVKLSAQAAKELRELPNKKVQRQVVRRLEALAADPRPRGCRKLGEDIYRIRSGNYRVVYCVRDEEVLVLVLRIGDRKSVYRDPS